MIKFVTALLDVEGNVIGQITSDEPLGDGVYVEGASLAPVAAVVVKEAHQHSFAHQWRDTLCKRDGDVCIHDHCRQYVNAAISSPTTAAGIREAAVLNPMVAHWLKRCNPAAKWGSHVDEAAAARPDLAPTIEQLHTRRHTPDRISRFRMFDTVVREAQIGASAWAEIVNAGNVDQPGVIDAEAAAEWARQLAAGELINQAKRT